MVSLKSGRFNFLLLALPSTENFAHQVTSIHCFLDKSPQFSFGKSSSVLHASDKGVCGWYIPQISQSEHHIPTATVVGSKMNI